MKKRKVGIITIYKCNNYGADLQAYALVRKLRLLGYDAEIIDYLYYKSWKFRDSQISRPLVPMTFKERFLYWLKYRFVDFGVTMILPYFSRNQRTRMKRFFDFHNEKTPSSRPYRSMEALYSIPPSYDIYMTGSDQVWNPSSSSSIEPYFLTFAPKGIKRVSYASSFGINKIEDFLRPLYTNYLNQFDSISVRESEGCELVKSLCGKEATWVLDPTLLLNKKEWMEVAKKYPNIPNHYVLIYQLSDSHAIVSLAKRISEEKNVPILRISKRAYWNKSEEGIFNIVDAGPSEFVALMAGADYILTNSFHGTAFAVNLGVPFWTIVSKKKKNNSRIESLLGLCGLHNRMLLDDCDIEQVDIEDSISNESVLQRLVIERQKSESFLRKIL